MSRRTRPTPQVPIPGPERPLTEKEFRLRVENGDLGAAVKYLADCEPSRKDEALRERSVRICIEAAAGAGPTEFIDQLIQHILKFDGALMLMSQAVALRTHGKTDYIQPGVLADDPSGTAQLWLERAGRLEDRVMQVCELYAKLQHVLALAKPKPKPRSKPEKIVYLNEPAPTKEVNAGG